MKKLNRYKVTGHAMVPVEVAVIVQCERIVDAPDLAASMFRAIANKQKYIVPGSEDFSAVHSWQPIRTDDYPIGRMPVKPIKNGGK